jgi:hypothetical protein
VLRGASVKLQTHAAIGGDALQACGHARLQLQGHTAMEPSVVASANVENLKRLGVVRVMPDQARGFAAGDLACLRPLNLSLL